VRGGWRVASSRGGKLPAVVVACSTAGCLAGDAPPPTSATVHPVAPHTSHATEHTPGPRATPRGNTPARPAGCSAGC
jgi:hypothetical protein